MITYVQDFAVKDLPGLDHKETSRSKFNPYQFDKDFQTSHLIGR